MESISQKLQGLWVGAALGELYANGLLTNSPAHPTTLTARTAIGKTYGLSLLTARLLKTAIAIPAYVQQCRSWQETLLGILPLTFLHPTGAPGLVEELTQHLSLAPTGTNRHPEEIVSAITLVKTLEGLLANPQELHRLIPDLLNLSALDKTQTAQHLTQIQDALVHSSIHYPVTSNAEAEWSPDRAIATILYTFLSSPADFRLTVQRAAQFMPSCPELILLVAALSGFHNGFRNLPLPWRWVLRSVDWTVSVPLEQGLCTLANRCVARWSGCFTDQMLNASTAPWHVTDSGCAAIALPGQLRPRSQNL